MARRKKTGKTTADFNNSPFKSLKGLAVSGSAPSPVKDRPGKVVAQTEECLDDAAMFEREMHMLKVKKSPGGGRARRLPPEPAEPASEGGLEKTPQTDQELFLEAIGNMDSVFRDELPPSEEPHAVPRRMRQLRQGKLVPEAELDLHGANREQARQKVRYFLEDCVYQGYKTVLIITGRGKGSQEGPVLRDEMEKYLAREAQSWVIEWGRAPARYGGEGALVAFLRSSRK